MTADGYNDGETEASPYGFDSVVDDGNSIARSSDAVHDGTYGIEFTFDDATVAYGVLDLDAVDQVSVITSFWFNRNNVSYGAGDVIIPLGLMNGTPSYQVAFYFYGNGDFLAGLKTDTTVTYSSRYASQSGWHHYLIMWAASTGAGNDDGYVHVYIDGVYISELSQTGVDNDAQDVDKGWYGIPLTTATAFSGSLYMDEIYIDPTEKYWCYLVAGTITPTGAYTRGVGKPITGTITPTSTIDRLVAWYRSLAGTVTPVGAVIKGLAEAMSGVLTPTGTIVKGMSKALAGAITPAGRLLQRVANFFRIFFDASPETVARIDITNTADVQLDDSPETTVILER